MDGWERVLEAVPIGIVETDPAGRLRWANRRWEVITSHRATDLIGKPLSELIHPDDRAHVAALQQETGSLREQRAQHRITTSAGEVRWVLTRTVPVFDDDGELTGHLGSYEDVTQTLEAQELSGRLANIAESTSDMVAVVDPDGCFSYLNRAAREFHGIASDVVTSSTVVDYFTPMSRAQYAAEILPVLQAGRSWSGELEMYRHDGESVPVWQTIAPELAPSGELQRLSAVGRDVTDQKRFEAELAHQATHDPLTGLPNRSLLLDHLDLAIKHSSRTGASVALLYLDLDQFKTVNDRHGHEAGDTLLRQVATRLVGVLRPFDTVARLGGDEFVVLCAEIAGETQAAAVAARVLDSIEGLPFSIAGADVRITASVGIAMPSSTADHPEGLLREADAAMYRAKAQGRARYELFDEGMRSRAARHHELADELRDGLDRNRIALHFQAVVEVATGRIVGAEALIRWQHPRRGLLLPSDFMGVAEDTGLIVPIGAAVLELATVQLRQWQDELGDRAPRVHINISPRQLAAPNLVDVVRSTVADAGVDASALCFEVTEMALMGDAPGAARTLGQLNDLGVSLAIDDFGTGQSSLAYLRRFPVRMVKIDRSFIDGLGPDPEDSAIVAAVVRLAHTLGLQAVAEGVETEDQLNRLRNLGCHLAQGFLLARPGPAAELDSLLKVHHPFPALLDFD